MSTPFTEVFGRNLPESISPDDPDRPKDRAAGLALSGGGYRAMLFHVGALRRLYEIGALSQLKRISSVSGGSMAAAQLALSWNELMRSDESDLERFVQLVESPCLEYAGQLVDVSGGIRGVIMPRRSIAQSVARTYQKWYGPSTTLQDLPDGVDFIFCATNLGTGSVVRFGKRYMADRRVGQRRRPNLLLGDVVAASAAFPPVLSPMRINLNSDQALTEPFDNEDPPLRLTNYARLLELSDGGVYDNLGLQPIDRFATVLVSDGGGPFDFEDGVATNWLQHMIRCWKVTDNQVRALRRGALVDEFRRGSRHGTFWGISTKYSDYPSHSIEVDDSWAGYLRAVSTRLAPIDEQRQRQLINFGYCLCDAAIRSYVTGVAPSRDAALPYPEFPLRRPAPAPRRKPPWKFWTT